MKVSSKNSAESYSHPPKRLQIQLLPPHRPALLERLCRSYEPHPPTPILSCVNRSSAGYVHRAPQGIRLQRACQRLRFGWTSVLAGRHCHRNGPRQGACGFPILTPPSRPFPPSCAGRGGAREVAGAPCIRVAPARAVFGAGG